MKILQQGDANLPWGFDLARYGTSGVDYISKFGFNPACGTSVEPIWAESGVSYTFPSVAQTMTVSSANANDTSAGTGARTIYIEGLDANYLPISETVALNGQTGVTLVNQYLRIHRAYILTAGSGGTNAGIVYVGYGNITAGKPATVQAHLVAGVAQSLLGYYTIPANRTGYLMNMHFRSDGKGEFLVYRRDYGGIFRVQIRLPVIDTIDIDFQIPLVLPSKTDFQVRGLAATSTNKMGVTFDMVLT